MKKIIFLFAFVIILLPTDSFGQNDNPPKKEEYCILRIYGRGWIGKFQKILIIYEDLKVEKKELPNSDHEEIIKTTMENITLIKNKGYSLVTSSNSEVNGAEVYEYIFKKQQ